MSSNQNTFTSACLILQYNGVKFSGCAASLKGAFMVLSVAPQNLPELTLLLCVVQVQKAQSVDLASELGWLQRLSRKI